VTENATYQVQHVLSMKNRLGEGPTWSVQEQALYWCDLIANQLFKYSPATEELKTFNLDVQPGCLALLEDGRLLMGTAKGFAFYDFEKMSFLEDNAAFMPAARFNDGKVDRQGRFWAGTAPGQPTGHLYRLDSDGKAVVMESSIGISNGIGWSPDNTVMYYSDSGGDGALYAYDFDMAAGTIGNRRVFQSSSRANSGVVDGLTVDSEGCIWCAYWDGWRVERIAPDGQLLATIPMPVQRPTSCNFGGADMTRLYITSAGADMDVNQQPQAGDVFSIDTGVKGLPEPAFKIGAGLQNFMR
jgi:L-arabinonolactonase